jgi:hypothetical protein
MIPRPFAGRLSVPFSPNPHRREEMPQIRIARRYPARDSPPQLGLFRRDRTNRRDRRAGLPAVQKASEHDS